MWPCCSLQHFGWPVTFGDGAGIQAQLVQEVSELTAHALVLYENSSQPIVKLETTGIIRAINPTAEERFGYRADELLGRSMVKLLPEES